jgi:ketosteroid isomerase-like protein
MNDEDRQVSDDLIAEAGIRRLHARYADAVFRKDFTAFADCFTDDAVWLIGGLSLRGPSECAAFLQDRLSDSHWVLLTFRPALLDIGTGTCMGTAAGRTYVTEINARKTAPPLHNVATYFERFTEQRGVWRRSWAYFQLHYMGPEDLSGHFISQPDFGPPPAMPPGDAPPTAPKA